MVLLFRAAYVSFFEVYGQQICPESDEAMFWQYYSLVAWIFIKKNYL